MNVTYVYWGVIYLMAGIGIVTFCTKRIAISIGPYFGGTLGSFSTSFAD